MKNAIPNSFAEIWICEQRIRLHSNKNDAWFCLRLNKQCCLIC